jgi:uncharacterized protein DUF6152
VLRPCVCVSVLLVPVVVFGHHSVASWFDTSQFTELEGELTEVRWQNPHIVFTLKVRGENGQETLWDMESLSLSGVTRTGLTPDLLVVGQTLKVAGNPSKRNLNNVFVRNILLPSGQEIVLGGQGGQARFTTQASLRGSEVLAEREGDTSAPAQGIFRVWSTGSGTSMIFPENVTPNFDFSVYPLTASAKATVEAFDIFEDDPTRNCTPKGMTLLMEQPYPMEFVREGEDIVIRLEEYDSRRVVHMGSGAAAAAPSQPPSALGYSIGRWENDTLVVTTTRVNYGHFDSVGIPLSEAVEIVERFTPSADGARLDYKMTVTDAATFTRPVEVSKHWIWLPGITVGRYACSPQ